MNLMLNIPAYFV